MFRLNHLFFFLLAIAAVVGCSDQGGVVATDEELKAHVEEHGDLGLDPAASTDLTD